MKKLFAIVCILLGVGSLGFGMFRFYFTPLLMPVSSLEVVQYHRVLDRYTFARLREKKPIVSPIHIGRVLKKTTEFTSYLFTFQSDGKTVSGLVNLPANVSGKLPVIVLIRGYVEKEEYQTGVGTRRAAEEFATQGYLTLAPDFLGYGASDPESEDIFAARFSKPATVINLLASLGTLPQADTKRIGMWGHSNGGQIALSVLEITQRAYPTTLWAPVTQAFPDAVLTYVDDLPDKGAYIKQKLDEFHERYDDKDYSIAAHWDELAAPLTIHQGAADADVAKTQTDAAVSTLKSKGKTVTYFTYPKENHNFTNGSFAQVIASDLAFFAAHLR